MNYTILVADDSKSYFDTIEEAFRQMGDHYKLIWAGTGKMACLLAEQYLPDLILMDVIMPEMNGVKAIQTLKENPLTADIPVIMLSASESLQAAYETGAHDFISKPFNVADIISIVAKSFERRSYAVKLNGLKERIQNLRSTFQDS